MTQTDETTGAPFEADDETGTSDRRRLAAMGVVAALVLAAGGWFLLGGDDDSTTPLVVKRAPHVAQPAAKPAARKPVALLPAASTVKLGRDPFRPLYVVPAAPAAPADPGTTTGTGTTTTGTGTTTTGTGTTTTGTGTTSTPTTAPKPTTYALKLSRVEGTGSNLTARFLIGASKKIQYARAGSVFGLHAEIRLLSIQKGSNGNGTVVIQVGDGSPFDLSTYDAAIYVQ